MSKTVSVHESAVQITVPARGPRQKQVRLAAEAIEQLVLDYLDGDSMEALGRSYGINMSTVRGHLRKHGAKRPQLRGGYRKVHGELLVQATELYAAGLSLRSVAAELGVSKGAVQSGLIAGGIPIRSSGHRGKT